MNKYDYLRRLDKSLSKLSASERADAIAYYAEYFDEAGPENEQRIIWELGSPAKLAQSIRAEAAYHALDDDTPKVRKGISAVWFAILGVFAAPIALPIAIALFAIAFALLVSIGAVLIALVASAFSVFASGLGVTVLGFVLIPQSGPSALFYIGSGLILSALGYVLLLAVVLLSRITFKGIASLMRKSRERRAAKRAAKHGYTGTVTYSANYAGAAQPAQAAPAASYEQSVYPQPEPEEYAPAPETENSAAYTDEGGEQDA